MLGNKGADISAIIHLMPSWWPLMRAAKWIGVPPWELAKQSTFWREAGNEAASAVARAEEQLNDPGGGYAPVSGLPPGAVAGPPL